MKIDTTDYYPWRDGRKRPAEVSDDAVAPQASEVSENIEDSDSKEAPEASGAGKSLGISESEAGESEPPEAPKGWLTMISHFLSWIFSPIVIPTLGIICFFELSMFSFLPASSKWLVTGIVFSLTGVIPGLAVYLLTRFGDVSDVALTRRSDRLLPYLITIGCLLACGFYLTKTGLPEWVGYFFIGAAAASVVCLIVNFKWKISAHGAGIGGLVALLMILNRYGLPSYNLWGWVVGAVVCVGLLGAARVWLWRHTPMQTICGAVVGFLGVMLMESFI